MVLIHEFQREIAASRLPHHLSYHFNLPEQLNLV